MSESLVTIVSGTNLRLSRSDETYGLPLPDGKLSSRRISAHDVFKMAGTEDIETFKRDFCGKMLGDSSGKLTKDIAFVISKPSTLHFLQKTIGSLASSFRNRPPVETLVFTPLGMSWNGSSFARMAWTFASQSSAVQFRVASVLSEQANVLQFMTRDEWRQSIEWKKWDDASPDQSVGAVDHSGLPLLNLIVPWISSEILLSDELARLHQQAGDVEENLLTTLAEVVHGVDTKLQRSSTFLLQGLYRAAALADVSHSLLEDGAWWNEDSLVEYVDIPWKYTFRRSVLPISEEQKDDDFYKERFGIHDIETNPGAEIIDSSVDVDDAFIDSYKNLLNFQSFTSVSDALKAGTDVDIVAAFLGSGIAAAGEGSVPKIIYRNWGSYFLVNFFIFEMIPRIVDHR